MKDSQTRFIEISQLRTGMFVALELGWMAHPFPTGSFKITSDKQIEAIRALGLTRVRWHPERSDPALAPSIDADDPGSGNPPADVAAPAALAPGGAASSAQRLRASAIEAQQQSLAQCERRFAEAIRLYRQVIDQRATQPQLAMEQTLALVSSLVGELLADGESAIRLLSQTVGDRNSMHPVNVTVISLLLGKAIGLDAPSLIDLGLAAFLHDIGKTALPTRVRWLEESFSAAEFKLYQEHVKEGVLIGRSMQLSQSALLTIAQHHELADGSGFPARLRDTQLSVGAKVLALVNRYDNLCNPNRLTGALTPHEALALIFAQFKTRFDRQTLSAFIRMMGVYPPGSVVQLSDERFGLVVSVNSARPLKPRMLVHEPRVPAHEALLLDLEDTPQVGIRRSLKPADLPAAAMAYLLPRQRIAYFFEPVRVGAVVGSEP